MSVAVQSLTHAELRAAVEEKSHELSKLIAEVYARRTDAELASVSRSFYELIDSANATISTFYTPVADNIVDSTDEYAEDTSGLLEAFENIPVEESKPEPPETLSVIEAAQWLDVGPQTVRSLLKKGRLKTKGKVRQGRPAKITTASVQREWKRRQK